MSFLIKLNIILFSICCLSLSEVKGSNIDTSIQLISINSVENNFLNVRNISKEHIYIIELICYDSSSLKKDLIKFEELTINTIKQKQEGVKFVFYKYECYYNFNNDSIPIKENYIKIVQHNIDSFTSFYYKSKVKKKEIWLNKKQKKEQNRYTNSLNSKGFLVLNFKNQVPIIYNQKKLCVFP